MDPINLAGAISRKRGTIVVVGDVPTGFDREPHFYKKELQVKMSCSSGPGRYDPIYEEKVAFKKSEFPNILEDKKLTEPVFQTHAKIYKLLSTK